MTEPDAGSAVTELKTSATPDGDGYRHQRLEGVLHPLALRRRLPRLCALRARRRRHRLGADRHAQRRAFARQDLALHVRRGVAPALLRRRLRAARERAAARAAASRSRSPASTSSASATPRARWRSAATASSRRASGRCSGASSAARWREFQGLQWKFADMKIKLEAAQLLLYRAASQRRPRAARRPRKPRSPRPPATRPASRSPTRRCR